MLRVLAGRARDALLEPRLSLFGWHHVIGNALLHTRPFFGQVWRSVYADLRTCARRVRVPTLVAWGARDHTIPPRCATALLSLLSDATLYESATGSHDWMIDHAPEFAAAVRDFVRRRPLVTPPAAAYNRRHDRAAEAVNP
jgi:pimeloyl-ACP methyl ester carboxylesterase